MKINISYLVAALLVMAGCKKMDDTYKKFVVPSGITYVERAKMVKTYSGLNRIQFGWKAPADPNVTHARIYWNNYLDSVALEIPEDADTVSYLLDIPEGNYSFIVKTYDDEGHQSVPVEVQGRSIGEAFLSNMFNRPLSRAFVDNADGQLQLFWGGADINNGSIGHELTYTDEAGVEKRLFVKAETGSTMLADYKKGTDLSYATWYIADTTSIDTLKTEVDIIAGNSIRYRLDKSKFQEYFLPNDAPALAEIGWFLRNMWDGRTNADPGFHTPDLPKPAHVTFDIGTSDYSLSSFRLWQRTDWGTAYGHGNPKTFALWGSNDPAADGSWDSWTKLGDFTSEAHDITAGELFEIPAGAPAFRYLRVQVSSTWGNGADVGPIVMMEIELMGSFEAP
ncbi:DUF4998 domain-containing protein [Parapedobacter sp.]